MYKIREITYLAPSDNPGVKIDLNICNKKEEIFYSKNSAFCDNFYL